MKRAFLSFLVMFFIVISLGFGFYFFSTLEFPFYENPKESRGAVPQKDSEEDTDNVHALLLFHASDYFVYRGSPIGFQYEMLKELEKGIGRNVEIQVQTEKNQISKALFENNFDIVCMDFNYSGFMLPFFATSIPHSYSYPVLVSGIKIDTAEIEMIWVSHDYTAISFFDDLSPYSEYAVCRNAALSTEELFEKIDAGEIPYLICDYNLAITLLPFYSNVRIVEKAGPQFERRWVLNKKNIQLDEDINHWLLDFKKTQKYRWIIKKYFSQESSLINASFANRKSGGISKYDAIIKKYAQQYKLDWRFIASIICQETKFVSGLTGNGGSYGLMQLMPALMEYYGISFMDDDDAHICAGTQHLNKLCNSFEEVENENEKLYFVAAAYNAGRGHLFDAQRLCTKYGENFKN
ncbi:MAG: transglycosylase SLT domain-containing protein, partial [Lentimicrobiaceae bacterium]|nr:transglycosylase SLT domain-containing protein [Lentimicrobiaceae bacterium]